MQDYANAYHYDKDSKIYKTIPKINLIKLPNIQKLRFNASSKMYWQKYSYSMYTRLVKRVEEIRHLLRVELELEL